MTVGLPAIRLVVKIVYLRKAGDDVISHCKCEDGRMAYPAQLDCPWCGCGWLFSCMSCRKAFTFAEGVEIDTTWEALAQKDHLGRLKREGDEESILVWIESMQHILRDVEVGVRYVILDGNIFPAASRDVEFNGWYSHHKFVVLPHFAALDDWSSLDRFLGRREYWQASALPVEEE